MKLIRKNFLVWKINASFVVVIVVVIGAFAFNSNRVYERDALISARSVARSQLNTILQNLKMLMLVRDNKGIRELINQLTQSDPVYGEIRLLSHSGHSIWTEQAGLVPYLKESRHCSVCHSLENPDQGANIGSFDEIIELPSGERAVWIMIPNDSSQSVRLEAHRQTAGGC